MIVKTSKGLKFGGYTEGAFGPCSSNSGITYFDEANIAFGFSLDLFKIYNYNRPNRPNNIGSGAPSIYSNTNYFGFNCLFHIKFSPYNKFEGFVSYIVTYKHFGKFEKDYEINNGWKNFTIQELEVFQIIFD